MTISLMILLAAPLAAGQPAEAKPQLAEPVRLGFAGVSIAIPEGLSLQPADGANLVLHARKVENGMPVLGLKLLAYPIPKGMTTTNFIKAAHPNSGQAFRQVIIHKEKPVRVAGSQGAVHVMSYEYRGEPLTGIWMFFLRPVKNDSFQMGYVLSVEAAKARGKNMLPTLIAVAASVELFDPVRPITEKIILAEKPVVSQRFGFSIRPPAWWKLAVSKTPNRASVTFFQTDYLFMGATMPAASFSARRADGNAVDCAEKDANRIAAYLKIKKIEHEVIHKGPAKMAGKKGHEIILSHAIPAVGDWPKKRMLVVRTVCAADIVYSLKLEYDTESKDELLATMDAIATGLVLSAPTEAPTTTASVPATAPATKPASAEAPDQTITPGYGR